MYKKLIKRLSRKSDYVWGFVNLVLILLAINLLAGNFGIFEDFIMRLSSCFVLIGFIFLNLRIRVVCEKLKFREKNTIIGSILILFSFFIILYFDFYIVWLTSIPLLIFGVKLVESKGDRENQLLLPLVSSFFYALFMIFIINMPVIWNYLQKFSLVFTSGVGSITGKAMVLGPSVSGLWILISILIVDVMTFIFSKKRENALRFMLSIVGIFVTWIIFLVILNHGSFDTTEDKINFQYIFLILGLIPFSIYYFLSLKHISFPAFSWGGKIKKLPVFLILALFFISIFIVSLYPYSHLDISKKRVVFYTANMLGTWDKPVYGRYGKDASGMFGMLPEYLNESGYSVSLYNGTVTSDVLRDVDVFAVINLNKSFSEDEHRAIWGFVERGGSLLVLGDHTDIAGIMHPLNDLLSPVGIRFRFDSGLPVGERWVDCIEILNHPLGDGIENEYQIEISVGATLNVSGDAFPIILGRYGFSDHGNYLNSEMANLGDYVNNPGEQLGDVILAAGAFYGKGKVLVFGDTSSFQNLALPYSYRLVHNVFVWLGSGDTKIIKYTKNALSILALISCLAIFLKWLKKEKEIVYLLSIVLAFSIILSASVNPFFIEEEHIGGENIVYIDTSHLERISLESYTSDATTGLMINLARNDYLPLMLTEFDREKISKSKILFLIAPTVPLSKDEVNFLKNYMSNGGLIVLSAGYQDYLPVSSLLNEFGFSIENIPLGPVPYVEENPEEHQNEPRFVDSWPVTIENATIADSFYNIEIENESYNLIMFTKYGLGGLIVIGDSQFLLDKNIESLYDYWPGNILFLKNIIDELKDRGVL